MRKTGYHTKNRRKISLTGIFCLFFILCTGYAMQQNPLQGNTGNKKVTKIFVVHADSFVYQEAVNPDVRALYGNITFRHDSTYMYCDSAYLYGTNNTLEAFDNVRIEQGDTLYIYGDYLKYNGNTSIAEMRENVRMENISAKTGRIVTLFTDHFNYDRNKNIGYYFDGGMIVDSLNELTSVYGQYSPDTKDAFFKETVRLKNPQFVLTSDTLEYNTETKIATILGPSVIESDSGTIYSSRGWYNTLTEESMLYDRSTVVSKDKFKNMTADSMFYNRLTGIAEAYQNMVLNDTVKKVILTGHYGFFNDPDGYAFSTDSAQFIEYSQGDSLFLHADTLQMRTIGENDREIKAFHNVRFFRSDIQGVCDSMQFNTQDSILYMYKNPILWNTGYQMWGDTIQIFFNDSTIDRIHVINYAFATEKVDTTYFNQLKGRDLMAYFSQGELSRIEISGNAETIYYPVDNGAFTGRNKTESSYIAITIKNRKPVRIAWRPQTNAQMLPIPDLNPENKFLKDFVDFDYLRPHSKQDIFLKTVRKTEDVPPPRRKRYQ